MTQDQFLFLASLMVTLAAVRYIWLSRKPAERTFHCARCQKPTEHNERTIHAWRYNKVDFFCDACHAHWRAVREKHPRPASSGCFGAVVAIAAVPLLGLAWFVI